MQVHPANFLHIEGALAHAKRGLGSALRTAEHCGLGGLSTRLLRLAERVEREQARVAAMREKAGRQE